jgi:small-conductance mechanosensitive channel
MAIFLMGVIIFFIWASDIQSVTTIISVIGAGITLALHEVILCLAGWLLIMTRKPFDTGDRIEFVKVR